jgi:hypothetical protein
LVSLIVTVRASSQRLLLASVPSRTWDRSAWSWCSIEASKLIEALTPLLIGINSRYKTHAGIRITGLPDELW